MSTDLKERMHAALKAARDIASAAEAAGRDLTDDESAKAAQHLGEYTEAKAAFEKAQKSHEVKAALDAIGLDLGLERNEPEMKSTPSGFVYPTKQKSIGSLFTESSEYKGLMGSFNGGHINEKSRVQSQPFGVKAIVTGASDTSGGAFVSTDVTGIYEGLGRRPLTIRDLISVRQTESDTVEFVRQTATSNAAAPVPEATSAAADATTVAGGYKPEGSMAFEKVTETVKTIAVWVPATKRSLSDASQLRGLIDDELRADLAEEEEDQILNGSGSGENLRGILETSGTQAQAYDTDIFVTARKARRKVRTVGRSTPTAYLLNPEDWERFDLAREDGATGAFLGAGPFGNQGPQLWGLPVVESEAVPVGTGLVGDFRKAVLWDREQASITATDSHADFFIRNLVAILGEQREAFGVIRPSAFVEIDLTSA